MIGGGRPLLSEILDQRDRVGAKSPIFDLFWLVSDSAVTPSEKSSININRKKEVHYALSNEPKMNIVRCP